MDEPFPVGMVQEEAKKVIRQLEEAKKSIEHVLKLLENLREASL